MSSLARDVATGRLTKIGAGANRFWKAHKGKEAWWVTYNAQCEAGEYADGHTYEVCLFNIGPQHSSPTWPVMAFWNVAEAADWERKLRKFARTLDPNRDWKHHDPEYNGDRRVGDWLKSHGFVRVNHIYWRLPA